MPFDTIDRRILELLQDDGRMTNVELAERVGLTAPPCLRRVRALEEAGAIRGYHAEIDAATLRLSDNGVRHGVAAQSGRA